jgi:hypothetical protein
MSEKVYPGDMSDTQWTIIRPLSPPAKTGHTIDRAEPEKPRRDWISAGAGMTRTQNRP